MSRIFQNGSDITELLKDDYEPYPQFPLIRVGGAPKGFSHPLNTDADLALAFEEAQRHGE